MKYDIQRHPVMAKEQIRIVPDVVCALRREE
jgi:hypothetical protein